MNEGDREAVKIDN